MSASRAGESLLGKEVTQCVRPGGRGRRRGEKGHWMWQQCGREGSPAGKRSRSWESGREDSTHRRRFQGLCREGQPAKRGEAKQGRGGGWWVCFLKIKNQFNCDLAFVKLSLKSLSHMWFT